MKNKENFNNIVEEMIEIAKSLKTADAKPLHKIFIELDQKINELNKYRI